MIAIDKITMAVSKMEKMVEFYSRLFDMSFQSFEAYDSVLFTGKLGEMELLLCPKSVAQVDADVNTIQLRFVVADVERALNNGLNHGGTALTDAQELEGAVHASLRDPDGNSLELIQASG